MTNDLFRDLLDGKIHVRKPVKPGIYFAPAGTTLDPCDMTGWVDASAFLTIDGLSFTPHAHWAPVNGWLDCRNEPAPADPRARALSAKQHQGHGPKDAPLRTRGRNNRYKEKS